tara:strand:+ start:50 stop:634 length:585 start_codon:yes stop_codon:yes gene_type:complete
MDVNISENNSKFNIIFSKIKKNLKPIIVFALILLIAFLLFLYLKEVKEKKEIKISNEFNIARLLIEKEKLGDAKEIFYEIIEKKSEFYSPLSLYLIIENNMEEDNEKILKSFDKIIKIKGIEKENKNLIKIKKALFLIDNNFDEQKILDELNSIINSESIWKKESIEIIGDYFLNKGDKLKSEEFYKLLNNLDS